MLLEKRQWKAGFYSPPPSMPLSSIDLRHFSSFSFHSWLASMENASILSCSLYGSFFVFLIISTSCFVTLVSLLCGLSSAILWPSTQLYEVLVQFFTVVFWILLLWISQSCWQALSPCFSLDFSDCTRVCWAPPPVSRQALSDFQWCYSPTYKTDNLFPSLFCVLYQYRAHSSNSVSLTFFK